MLKGETAFKLYDTYGFPLDLTQDALRARGVTVDYARVVDPESLLPPRPGAAAVALVAGRVGTTRLLDNVLLPPRP